MEDKSLKLGFLAVITVLILSSGLSSNKIFLKGQTISPTPDKPADNLETGIQALGASEKNQNYFILQFRNSSSENEREELSNKGVNFISYVPENSWVIELQELEKNELIREEKVRSLTHLRPEYRVDPSVKNNIEEKQNGSITVKLTIFNSSSLGVILNKIDNYGKIKKNLSDLSFELKVNKSDIKALSHIKNVRWISRSDPPPQVDNDNSRDLIEVNQVQSSPYNLKGGGFTGAVWDRGLAGNHSDLNYSGKRIVGDPNEPIKDHGTHVAGTMLGGGVLQNSLRGMAPDARLATYEWPADSGSSELYTETNDSIVNHDAIISQNSWSFGPTDCSYSYIYGKYADWSKWYDKIISGETNEVRGEIPIVFSAGNERNECSENYNTTTYPGTAKNVITVGAVDDSGDITSFSSWGPTDDGRIKPDVVANGYIVQSTLPNNNYGYKSGTSMAAPAVSGAAILLNEKFNNTFNKLPRPATTKGLLIHTAKDLNRTGPDYITGWGLVNTTKAVEYIETSSEKDLIKRGNLSDGEKDRYRLEVPSDKPFKITLVWSDYPGDNTISGGTRLRNDLDLVVKDSNNNRFYPWTLNWSLRTQKAVRNKEDHRNNVEQVHVDPTHQNKFNITVRGTDINFPDQSYSLLITSESTNLNPPNLTVESPSNTTYSSTPDFNISSDEPLQKAVFSIDGTQNKSMTSKNDKYFYNNSLSTSDGNHLVKFYGQDTGGKWSSENISFALDTTPPSITPKSPLDNANISDSFSIKATWSDSLSGIKSTTYELENSSGTVGSGTLNSTGNSNNFADGEYTIVYRVEDNVGNSKEKTRTIKIDNTPPEITSNNPVDGKSLKDSFNIEANWDDLTSVVSATYELENSSGTQKTGSLNDTVNSNSYTDGSYSLRYNITDIVGNSRIKTINIEFDNTPPTLKIEKPANNDKLSSDFDVKATWNDKLNSVDSSTFSVENSSGIQASGNLNSTVDISGLADGDYTVYYTVEDSLGNKNEKSISITVNQPPELQILSPENKSYAVSPDFNISSDEPLKEAVFSINGKNNSMNNDTSTHFYNTSKTLEDGHHTAIFYGKDLKNANSSESVSFTVDSTPPNLNPVKPLNNSNISGMIQVEATWSDKTSKVTSSKFKFESNSGRKIERSLNASINTSNYESGNYTITYNVSDELNNTNTSTIEVTVDNNKPKIRIIKPGNNSLTSGNQEIKASWSDNITSVRTANFSITNSSGKVISGDLNSTIDTNTLRDGNYTIKASAYDSAGNLNKTIHKFRVDNTPPKITSSHPTSGDAVRKEINVSLEVQDSSKISKKEYKLFNSTQNITSWKKTNTSPFNTSNHPSGQYNITFRASDLAGNTLTENKSFKIDNNLPNLNLTLLNDNNSSTWIKDNQSVKVECNDRTSSGDMLAVFSAGKKYRDWRNISSTTFNINKSGNHTYNFKCKDKAGNLNSSGLNLSIDRNTPSVNSTNPSNGSKVEREFSFTAYLTNESAESGLNINKSFINITEGSISNIAWSNSSVSADISGLGYSEKFRIFGNLTDNVNHSNNFSISFETRAEPTDSGGSSGGGGGGGGGGFSLTSDEEDKSKNRENNSDKKVKVELNSSNKKVELKNSRNIIESFETSDNSEIEITISKTDKEYNPPDNTDKYSEFNITKTTRDKANLNVTFKVNKSWYNRERDPENTHLYRQNNSKWQKLKTSIKEVRTDSYVFEANIPGFSVFIIATEKERKCEEETFYARKGGLCQQFTQCEVPEGWTRTPSCQNMDKNPENNTALQNKSERSLSGQKATESLSIIDKILLPLAIIILTISVTYYGFNLKKRYEISQTIFEIREAIGDSPKAEYKLINAETLVKEGKYKKASEELESLKNLEN